MEKGGLREKAEGFGRFMKLSCDEVMIRFDRCGCVGERRRGSANANCFRSVAL